MRYTAIGKSNMMDLNMATGEKVSYIWNNVLNYNL